MFFCQIHFFRELQRYVFSGRYELNADALELERIYVSKELQKNGFGSYLMEQTVAIAKQKGKRYIWLGVWEKNRRAISFYRKHGFYIIGTHEFVIGEDIQTDYIMRRDL